MTAEEKTQFTEAVEKQIEELKRTKKAVIADQMSYGGWGLFTASRATQMREAYEKEKRPNGGK